MAKQIIKCISFIIISLNQLVIEPHKYIYVYIFFLYCCFKITNFISICIKMFKNCPKKVSYYGSYFRIITEVKKISNSQQSALK